MPLSGLPGLPVPPAAIIVGMDDRGPVFDGVKIGRPATGALIDAGYTTLDTLPDDLAILLPLHGFGPSALGRLAEERERRSAAE